jgi:hypothetical protein
MKKFTLVTAVFVLFITGCSTSRQAEINENRFNTTFSALEKDNTNAALRLKAQEVYNTIQQKQLATIAGLGNNPDESRREWLVTAYATLQEMYETVMRSACCSAKVTVTDYQAILTTTREDAADHYYRKGEELVTDTSASAIRAALAAYQKALTFVPDYKDADAKAADLFSINSFVVAFNPVEDSSFFAVAVASSDFYTYSNYFFINKLISELQTDKSSIPFLVLMPYSDCLAKGITPDWMVDITIPRLDIPVTNGMKTSYSYERQQIGTDSSGAPIYSNVSVPYYYNADIIDNGLLELNVDITDASNGQTIAGKAFEATLGGATFSRYDGKRDGAINAMQIKNMSLRESAAMALYANVYDEYKKNMKALFEK